MSEGILIVTTGHWEGDPRLNRHVRYLARAGYRAEIRAMPSASRWSRLRNVFRAAGIIWRSRHQAVLLPDPELYVVGAITARWRGKTAVVDIHEDYPRAASGRDWVPRWLRGLVSLGASLNDRLARRFATLTLVAAPQLARRDSVVVLNVPDPEEFDISAGDWGAPSVAYVGDVTEARGALSIAALAGRMPQVRFLVVGRVAPSLASQMRALGGPNLDLAGRLPHREAWAKVSGAIAGLSLLDPLPAYRDAIATKLWEYSASGIPPVVSDLPGQRALVGRIAADLVVADLESAQAVIARLASDRPWSEALRAKSRLLAEEEWSQSRPDQALQEAFAPLPITRNSGPPASN